MAYTLTDNTQSPAVCCRDAEIELTGILYCQNMPPGTGRASAFTPSLYNPAHDQTEQRHASVLLPVVEDRCSSARSCIQESQTHIYLTIDPQIFPVRPT